MTSFLTLFRREKSSNFFFGADSSTDSEHISPLNSPNNVSLSQPLSRLDATSKEKPKKNPSIKAKKKKPKPSSTGRAETQPPTFIDGEIYLSSNDFTCGTTSLVAKQLGARDQLAFETLRQTHVVFPEYFNFASSTVKPYLNESTRLIDAFHLSTARLRNCASKLESDALDGLPGLCVWLKLGGNLSWFGDWDERNLLKIRSEWIHLFSAEKQARKAHKRIHKAANLFQTNLQNHAQSLLKVKHLKEHFQSVFPPRWADTFKDAEFRLEFAPRPPQNPKKADLEIWYHDGDLSIFSEEEASEDSGTPPKAVKFSLLKPDAQTQFVTQILATCTFILTQFSVQLETGRTLVYEKEMPLRLLHLRKKELRHMRPFDHLLLTCKLKDLFDAHAEDAVLISVIQKTLLAFKLLLDITKEGLYARRIFRESSKRKTATIPDSHLQELSEFSRHFQSFRLNNYAPVDNLLMRAFCRDFVSRHGKNPFELIQKRNIKTSIGFPFIPNE